MQKEKEYRVVINSDYKLLDLHIKETLHYRDLIKLFVKRDFVSLYKQTILGPAWAIIQPLFTTVVFTIIFGNLAGLTTADIDGSFIIPGFLFYMIGNICWNYFSSTLQSTSDTFISNSHIMGKVYYPRLVTPISIALSHLISFGIQFILFIVFWLFFIIKGGTSIVITPALLLIPLVILQMIILSVGCGIIISSCTTKYRDLRFAVSFGLQLWQYASPIAYGLTLIPSKYLHLYMLNPVTPIITTFRYALFGFGYFNPLFYLISWIVTIIVFIIGVIMFSKIERTFMDTI